MPSTLTQGFTKGVMLVTFAVMLFALTDVLTKHLTML